MNSRLSDVVVVGAGTAGAVVATRLVDAGASVTLLEAGPDYGALSAGRWPADLLDAASLPTSHDWAVHGPAADGRDLHFDRAKVIGGCSAHNGSTMSVGWRADWDLLPAGWQADDLRASFTAAAARTRVRVPDDDEVQPFQRAFLDACDSLGLRRRDDLLDVDGGEGTSVSPVNIVDGVRWNTALAYLDDVRSSPLLQIVPDCHVDRIELASGRVRAVLGIVDGEVRRFPAGLVVLAAGAYGTPAILERSGIGDASRLAGAGIAPVVHLPGVGAGLQDHPVLRIIHAATPELVALLDRFRHERGFLPEEQCVAKLASGPSIGAPYDVHLFPWIEPDDEHGWRCVFPVGLLRPRSVGSVRVRSADPMTLPTVDHGYLTDPSDTERLLDALAWVRRMLRSAALAPLLGEELLGPPTDDRADLTAWARSTHQHYWHPTGGACIGGRDDPSNQMAVCDERAGVRGVEGLVVADASLLPHVPRCTPALPVTALGEHVARRLLSSSR